VLPGEAEVVFGVKVRLGPTWMSWFMAGEQGRKRRREGLDLHGDWKELWSRKLGI